MTRDVVRRRNPLAVTFSVLLVAAVPIGAVALASSELGTLRVLSPRGTAALLFLAIAGLALGNWFWQVGVATLGATRAGMYLYLEPLATLTSPRTMLLVTIKTVRRTPVHEDNAMTRTWPEDWDARKQGVDCWFCKKQLGQPFYAGAAGDAHLERHPIARGHAIVVFRDHHVADFTSLTPAEVAAYWTDVHTVARMIEQVFAPCHMNYQLLGNLVPHLHVHLVPRYIDDPAPGRPIPWEPKALDESEFDTQVRLLLEASRTLGVPASTMSDSH